MAHGLARGALAAYRWAGVGVYPFLKPYLAIRGTNGELPSSRRKERFGHASQERPDGPLVWFHATRAAGVTAVLPLIREVRKRGIQVLLTTGTANAAEIVMRRMPEGIIHQYVPLDLSPAVRRFLEHWQPDAAIMAEPEVWPVTVMELGARHIPQIIVNGRLSDATYARWKRAHFMVEQLFRNLALVIAQTDADSAKYASLGALPVLVAGSLEAENDPLPVDQDELQRIMRALGPRKCWAAVFTHPGEEEMVGRIHRQLKSRNDQLTIIVPHERSRVDEVEEALAKSGLEVARLSSEVNISASTDILLADRIADLGIVLRVSEIAFIGGSIGAEGGQSPMEAAQLGCAVLSGGAVQNFRESYQRLAKNGSAKIVRDEQMLAKGVHYLMNNDEVRGQMIEAGQNTLYEMKGALAMTMKGLEPYVSPLALKVRLDSKRR